MNPSALLSVLALAFAAGAFGRESSGASSAYKPAPTERIALDLIKNNAPDAELPTTLKQLGIGAGPKRDEIVALVKAMRAVVADNVEPGSSAFWQLLDRPVAGKPTGSSATMAGNANAVAGASGQARAESAQAIQEQVERKGAAFLSQAIEDAFAETEPVDDYHTFFHAGLRMLTPYTVNAASIVESDKTRVGGFLEFVHTFCWAWRPDRREATKIRTLNTLGYPLPEGWERWDDNTPWAKLQQPGRSGTKRTGNGQPLRTEPNPNEMRFDHWALLDMSNGWDAGYRLSFEFGADDSASASTVTGSGDFSAEVTLDKHIVRGWTKNSAFSISLGGAVAAVTDRSAIRVHPRYLGGPSVAMSFDDPLKSRVANPRRGLFTMRLGRAVIDSVMFHDRTKLELRTVSPGVPRYVKRYANAIEAELFYPLGQQSLITAGARVYNGSTDLAPWSLYMGVTTPLTKIAKGLFPK